MQMPLQNVDQFHPNDEAKLEEKAAKYHEFSPPLLLTRNVERQKCCDEINVEL